MLVKSGLQRAWCDGAGAFPNTHSRESKVRCVARPGRAHSVSALPAYTNLVQPAKEICRGESLRTPCAQVKS